MDHRFSGHRPNNIRLRIDVRKSFKIPPLLFTHIVDVPETPFFNSLRRSELKQNIRSRPFVRGQAEIASERLFRPLIHHPKSGKFGGAQSIFSRNTFVLSILPPPHQALTKRCAKRLKCDSLRQPSTLSPVWRYYNQFSGAMWAISLHWRTCC